MRTRLTLCHNRYTLLVALLIGWPQMAAAQVPSGPGAPNAPRRDAEKPDKNYILRTYEVGDLILNIKDHPYSESLERIPRPVGGGMGGGGGGGIFSVPNTISGDGHFGRATRFAVTGDTTTSLQFCQFGGGRGEGGMGPGNMGPAASITLDDLKRVLISTVASDSWAESGGDGQVESLGTALVVWQTAAVHEQIDHLLKQIRKGSADRKTVTIDARWLQLNSDELDSLLLPDQEGVPQVDRKMLAEFTRRPGSIRGITNCFSSQLVYLVSGTRRNIVSGYIPVVGSAESPDHGKRLVSDPAQSLIRFVSDTPAASGGQKGVGYQPIIEKPNFGALLEIRPTLMQSDATAVVDLKSTITVPGEQRADSGGSTESVSIAPVVDRIAIETQELVTTLRIPLGKPILVGGLTYVPAYIGRDENNDETLANKTELTTTEKRQLYFVLEVR